jgi:hypothetical protein
VGSHEIKKPACDTRVEIERWRKLDEQRPAFPAKARRFLEKPFERRPRAAQLLVVSDRSGEFDGEAKVLRRAARPPGVCGCGVWPVK